MGSSSKNETKRSDPALVIKLRKMAGRLLVEDDRRVALDMRDRVLARLESTEFHDSMNLETPTVQEGNLIFFQNEDLKDDKSPATKAKLVGIKNEIEEDNKGSEKERKKENQIHSESRKK